MLKNTPFLMIFFCFFTLIGSIKAQDNILDLQKANRLLSVAQERDRVASAELEEVKSARTRLEEDLVDLQGQLGTTAKAEKKKIEAEVKKLRKQEESLMMKRKFANNLLVDVTDILQASPKKRAQYIKEFEKRFGPIKLTEVVDNKAEIMLVPPSVQTPKVVVDPVAQLETQAVKPKANNTNDDDMESTPSDTGSNKKKKETAKKDKNAISTRIPSSDTSPKKKKETPKKPEPKTEPKFDVIAMTVEEPQTEPKKQEPTKSQKKNQIQQKTKKAEKPREEVVVEVVPPQKTEPKPKKVKQPKAPKTKPIASEVTKAAEPDVPKPTESDVPKTIGTDAPTTNETIAVSQNDVITVAPEPKIEPKIEPKKESKKNKKESKPANEKSRTESSKTVVNYKKFDLKDDVMMTTPTNLDCNLAFDGMDNFTGKKKQETTPIVLFAHTDDFMRATMKNKDFVTCDATATRVEGSRTVYLNLTLTILSKDAQRTFGFLDRGALIIFRFINGKKVSLSTNKTDIGVVDVDKGTTTFRAQLAIAETIELTASELDAVRVSWSIGYEDYEIFDMDILRNLFKCLDKK